MSGAVPPPAARPLGRVAGVPRPVCPGVRSVRALGPSTGPTACALAGRRCSLWWWWKGVPGGGAFLRCEGRLRSGTPPPPTSRPLGGLLGSATHVLRARVCGRGGPAPAPWLACSVGGCAPRGWRGASEFRRPLFPAARPLGWLPGPAGHVLWARVWVCAVCVVSVRCVLWCVVLSFSCPSCAPLSGAAVRCCARRVLCACRAPFPAGVPCLAAGYPLFLSRLRPSLPLFTLSSTRPSPWHALFPCLRPGVCLCLCPRRLVFLSRWAL